MFDFFKELFGRNSCRGCKHRCLWGLCCGLNSTRPLGDPYAKSAWQKYGCWYFVDKNTGGKRNMSNEKLVVKQKWDSQFMIVHHDPKTDGEKFFGGFYNEIECPGTDDESFAFGMESWVERPEDGAAFFKTLQEAKDFLSAIDRENRRDCAIVLYGKDETENDILGSHWYPLKSFVGID